MCDELDEGYFESYAHHAIHEEMLKDTVRTLAYRDAMLKNNHLFKDKVVLDVGCGTGILSMFAAQAGARLVIGVDKSNIVATAQKIVERNGLSDRVTLVRGAIEDVQLPVAEVDIIVSEWMGYFLLYEAMLDSVLFARDRYLKKDGLLFPDRATLRLAALEDAVYKMDKIYFWEDVYGFDMSEMQRKALADPVVDFVPQKYVCTDVATLREFDLKTVQKSDLSFASQFALTLARNDMVHGFVGFFTCTFSSCTPEVVLSTAPDTKRTHWKQCVFYLARDILGDTGKQINGTLLCRPHPKNKRNLEIDIEYSYDGNESERLHFNFG
ncbi:MAG: protein arginine N-methyltransferase [Amphiamblys sp. WSBS2006]|nr:MAG: protein arginine N-methyltransferase [Amphiamblys sp. WSBS2006]